MAATKPRRAPRMAGELRRDQLVDAAVGPFAAQGYDRVQLQAIADEVGITRNLIHRYFPGGKRELYVEAVRLACLQLAELLDVSPDVPLEQKTPANIATYLDAILEPNPIYVLYARAERSADSDVRGLAQQMRDTLISRVAVNNLGTPDPPPELAAALNGFIAFTEATAESWRDQGLDDRGALEEVLNAVFLSVIAPGRQA